MFKFDVHCHTTHSDGVDSPSDMLAKLKRNNDIYSIADHNNFTAHEEVTCSFTGAEIDVAIEGFPVEALIYKYNKDVVRASKVLGPEAYYTHKKLLCEETERFLASKGFIVECGITYETPSALLRVLCSYQYNLTLYNGVLEKLGGLLFRNMRCNRDFILYNPALRYCSVDVKVLLQLREHAGGLLFLSHPFLYSLSSRDANKVLNFVVNNFDGLEVFHCSASAEEQKSLLSICRNNKLLLSGGSDHHGDRNGWLYETTIYNKLGWDLAIDPLISWMREGEYRNG